MLKEELRRKNERRQWDLRERQKRRRSQAERQRKSSLLTPLPLDDALEGADGIGVVLPPMSPIRSIADFCKIVAISQAQVL